MSEEHRARLRARVDVVSSRAAAAFDDALPSVEPLLGAQDLASWVDLGCAIATGSGVTAVKFFRESPALLSGIAVERRPGILRVARTLAQREPNTALELLRHAVPLTERLDDAQMDQWGRIGATIAEQDYDAAMEYVKESGPLAGVIPTDAFSLWGDVGVLLSREDRAAKDFLALSYFRSSADWLRAISDPTLRAPVLALASHVAAAHFPAGSTRRPGQLTLDILRHVHTLLDALPSVDARHALLAAGARVVTKAPALIEVFLRHAPEAIRLVEGSIVRFQEWVGEGLAIADAHQERAEAYFSLRSKQAVEVAQRLSRGTFLKDIKAALTFLAEAMCGRTVEIHPGGGASSALSERGGLITLPEKITIHATAEDNLRFYRVLTYHEAAHLEFGTYEPLPAEVATWFGAPSGAGTEGAPSLMRPFPDPGLAQILWTIAEEARIDFLLRHHYPGLRLDMDRVLFEQLRGRRKIETLPRRQAILEALLQLSVADAADVPLPVLEPVTHGYDIIKGLRRPAATVMDVLRAVTELYPLVAEGLEETAPAPAQAEPAAEPQSEFDQLAMGHAPAGSFAFRDTLQAPQVAMNQPSGPERRAPPDTVSQRESTRPREGARRDPAMGDAAAPGAAPAEEGFWYDEWDHLAIEYRPRWCRVHEQPATSGSPEDVDTLLRDTRGLEASLRRYFAVIRPEAFRRSKRQREGDEIDLDAATEAAVDRRARRPPSDRLYVRRDKRVRDVATALLIDVSGSTGRQIAASSQRVRRVIDVARESLALLGSALDALGDQFALYAFSGQSRHDVKCCVVKAFDERLDAQVFTRISGLAPQGQNRDGAAIRHVARRLRARDAAVKLLIVLSDGRPLDDEYAGEYALEDTRSALREAQTAGLHTFGVTVDTAADRYIEQLYGDVRYTVIDDVAALPERLPRLYKRLTT